jgi:hypothetical protein
MGGRTGGWDHRDHDSFIKVWTQLGCAPTIEENTFEREVGERKTSDLENDEADRESHYVDEEDGDNCHPSRSDKGGRAITNGAIAATLPVNQISSLLRRLPLNVPGKLQEELEEHIEW